MKSSENQKRGAAKVVLAGLLVFLGACSSPMSPTGFTIPNPPAGGPPFTVTYYNFTVNTTGNTPTDPTSYGTTNTTVTVLANTGTPALSWPGFTFIGWNTKQVSANNLDGGNGGTFYAPGAQFTITANTYLFGVWQQNSSAY